MKYDFDTYVERRGTASVKWDTYPPDVLPMWIADSDFKSPPEVRDAIVETAQKGIFGYPASDGQFENACAGWMSRRFGWHVSSSQVLWSPSLGTAIALAVRSFTRPGEGVAMLWPIYPPFIRICKLNHREPRGTVLQWRKGNYHIDFDELESVLALPDTRLLLLCNPHNPTGRVFDRDELERIGQLCLRHEVVVFSDEIHSDIVYRGKHLPFPMVSEKLAKISLVGINASKTFNLADLRSGAILSENPDLLAAMQTEEDNLKLGRCSLGIAGVSRAWEIGGNYADQLVAYLARNLDHALARIHGEWPEIGAYKPDGTFLLWLNCEKLGFGPDQLENFFFREAKVGLNMGKDFGPGGDNHARMNFACPRSTLDKGLDCITAALERLRH